MLSRNIAMIILNRGEKCDCEVLQHYCPYYRPLIPCSCISSPSFPCWSGPVLPRRRITRSAFSVDRFALFRVGDLVHAPSCWASYYGWIDGLPVPCRYWAPDAAFEIPRISFSLCSPDSQLFIQRARPAAGKIPTPPWLIERLSHYQPVQSANY